MKLLAIAGISLALTAGVACGSKSTGQARSDGGVGSTTASEQDIAGSLEISGGSASQHEILSDAVDAFAGSSIGMPIREITIREPPPNYGATESACWLAFRATGGDEAENARAEWVALMLAGLFLGRSREQGLPPLAGKSLTLEGGRPDEGGYSRAPEHPVFIAFIPTNEIERRIREGAGETGAHVVSIEFPRVFETAVVIRLTADEAFVRDSGANFFKIFGFLVEAGAPHAEGVWTEVRSEDGALLDAGGYSARMLQGAGWTRPDLSR